MTNKSFIILFFVIIQFTVKAQQTYQLDTKKSKILWDNRKTMGGHHGYILFKSGTLNLFPGAAQGSGSFSIDMNSMSATDNPKVDGNQHVNKKLREENYFSIDKYPLATMNVKQIVRIGQSTSYKITGDLTIKNTTNPIEFTAVLITKRNVVGATATLTIDRLLWHIDMQAPNKPWDVFGAIQNKVTPDLILISLNLEFLKAD